MPSLTLPPVTVALDVPLPVVPIGADVTVGTDGIGVAVDATLPVGLGGVGGDVSVGGGGVAATVVVPTLPVVGSIPPITVSVTARAGDGARAGFSDRHRPGRRAAPAPVTGDRHRRDGRPPPDSAHSR